MHAAVNPVSATNRRVRLDIWQASRSYGQFSHEECHVLVKVIIRRAASLSMRPFAAHNAPISD